jgi:hypothetical protein
MKYAGEMGSGAIIYIHTEFHQHWFKHSRAKRRRFRDVKKTWLPRTLTQAK